jgi:hypothetical protein
MLIVNKDFIELEGTNKKITTAKLKKIRCSTGYVCAKNPNRSCSASADRPFFAPNAAKSCACGGGDCVKNTRVDSRSRLVLATLEWIHGLGPLAGKVQSSGRIEGLTELFKLAEQLDSMP